MDREEIERMNYSFKKVFLIILDGFGLAAPGDQNPVTRAGMSFLNSLTARYQAYSVVASGLVMGLPWGKPGNSEVGHSAIGTGRVIIQDWARINADIKSGVFYHNPSFIRAIEHCRKEQTTLHLIGCTSQGGIHAHEDHLIALLELAARNNTSRVMVHMITDGEDAGPIESLATLERLRDPLAKASATIATVMGRSYGMDRVFNWKLTTQAWEAIVQRKGVVIGDVATYIRTSHEQKIFDDQIVPAVVQSCGPMGADDAVIFFNYRNDRVKQLVSLFKTQFVVTMTRYANDLPVAAVAYEPPEIHHTLGKEISRRGLRQFRIAEQEKAAHINNFFNGGRIDPYEDTEQIIVASRQLKGNEYITHPAMSAKSITTELLVRVEKNFTFYLVNLANPDMMAHTGDMDATIAGLTVVDHALKEIADVVLKNPEYALVITADHGNCEEIIDPATGGPETQHSSNNVIAVFAGKGLEVPSGVEKNLDILAGEQPVGSLIDMAPSLLNMLSYEQPEEMSGSTLV